MREGLVWLIGTVECLNAASWVQLFASAGNGWLHNALRYQSWFMSVSSNFRDCKVLLSLENFRQVGGHTVRFCGYRKDICVISDRSCRSMVNRLW